MRRFARLGLAAVVAAALTLAAHAQQTRPAAGIPPQRPPTAGAPTPTQPRVKRPDDPRLNDAVATVNGEPITKRELVNLLGEFQIPPSGEQRAYEAALELLVNTKLLEQFLRRANVPTPAQEIQNVVSQYRKELQDQGTSLEDVLSETNTTLEEFQRRIARSIQWKKYVTDRATDEVLKKYLQDNEDVFRNTQVRASHILVKLDSDSSAEAKTKARQKIDAIKQEIASGKISFSDAANKYSEDDGNVAAKKGGDVGYFPRKGQFIEEFAAAAFANKDKKGALIGPIETEYGLHLIQITDVKEGPKLDPAQFLAQYKDAVLNQYAAELQNQIVDAERARAEKAGQIKTQPMPADLFKLIPPDIPPTPAGAAPKAGTAAPNAGR